MEAKIEIEKLKKHAVDIKEALQQYEQPAFLLEKFYPKNISNLPAKIHKLFNAYQQIFSQISDMSELINKLIKEAENKGESSVELSKEITEFIEQLAFKLDKLTINFSLLNNVLTQESQQDKIIFSTEDTETIALTNEVFSDQFIKTSQKEIQKILDVISIPFDSEAASQRINEKLNNITCEGLIISKENNLPGISLQHFRDYGIRHAYVFENNASLPLLSKNLMTNDSRINDLEKMTQAYLAHHKLSQSYAPNVRAMITTLLSQQGLPAQLLVAFEKTLFSFYKNSEEDAIEGDFSFINLINSSHASIFFDQETGMFHFETYLRRNPAQVVNGKAIQQGEVTGKVSIDVELKINQGGQFVFVANEPDFYLKVERNKDFALTHPVRLNQTRFNPQIFASLDETHVDKFRPLLEDLAKFSGYSSLEAAVYEHRDNQSAERLAFKAKTAVEHAKFTPSFIDLNLGKNGKNEKLSTIEKNFLKGLYQDYGEKKSINELSEKIFTFACEGISKAENLEGKMRYIYLLSAGEKLLTKAKDKADYAQRAVDYLADNKNLLYVACQENISIYRELIEPKITLSHIWRNINEFFGMPFSKSRPKFNRNEHFKIIASLGDKFNELLKNNRKDNVYRKIFNQLSQGQKFYFECKVDKQKKERSYKQIQKTLTSATSSDIKKVKHELPEFFAQYLNDLSESDTKASIVKRLAILAHADNFDQSTEIFGFKFLIDFHNQLCQLIKQNFDDSDFNLNEIALIRDIINAHEGLYKFFSNEPEVKKFLIPLHKDDNNYAENMSENIKSEKIEIKNKLNDISEKLNLIKEKITQQNVDNPNTASKDISSFRLD